MVKIKTWRIANKPKDTQGINCPSIDIDKISISKELEIELKINLFIPKLINERLTNKPSYIEIVETLKNEMI